MEASIVNGVRTSVSAFSYKETTGMFDLLQELELSSTETDAGAEILVGPSGQFVYASSRGTGVVVVYRQVMTTLITIMMMMSAGWRRRTAWSGYRSSHWRAPGPGA